MGRAAGAELMVRAPREHVAEQELRVVEEVRRDEIAGASQRTDDAVEQDTRRRRSARIAARERNRTSCCLIGLPKISARNTSSRRH